MNQGLDLQRNTPGNTAEHTPQPVGNTGGCVRSTPPVPQARIAAFRDALKPPFHRDALCPERPEVNFFPGRGESAEPAKATCRECLVRSECLTYALDHRIAFGVWGGLSERERRRVRGGSHA